jgi:hypothetical protein
MQVRKVRKAKIRRKMNFGEKQAGPPGNVRYRAWMDIATY